MPDTGRRNAEVNEKLEVTRDPLIRSVLATALQSLRIIWKPIKSCFLFMFYVFYSRFLTKMGVLR